MVFDPQWQNRDSDTHMSMSWEDISQPSDVYPEPLHYSESAKRKILIEDDQQ